MALPVTGVNVADAYNTLRDKTVNLQSYCTLIQSQIANPGSVSASLVLSALAAMVDLASYASMIAGDAMLSASIVSYVQQMVGNPTLDVATEFNNSLTALQSFISAVMADFPKDANGKLIDRSFDNAGNIIWVGLNSAQLPTVLPAMTSWLATVA